MSSSHLVLVSPHGEVEMAMDPYDSGDDIFITQNTFHEFNDVSVESIDTQLAVESVDSLWHEVRGNGDLSNFSNQKDNSSCLPDEPVDEDFPDVNISRI